MTVDWLLKFSRPPDSFFIHNMGLIVICLTGLLLKFEGDNRESPPSHPRGQNTIGPHLRQSDPFCPLPLPSPSRQGGILVTKTIRGETMRRKQGRGLGLCSPETVPGTRTRDFLEGGPRDGRGGSRKCESGKEKGPIDRCILN